MGTNLCRRELRFPTPDFRPPVRSRAIHCPFHNPVNPASDPSILPSFSSTLPSFLTSQDSVPLILVRLNHRCEQRLTEFRRKDTINLRLHHPTLLIRLDSRIVFKQPFTDKVRLDAFAAASSTNVGCAWTACRRMLSRLT